MPGDVPTPPPEFEHQVPSGIEGLDEILCGGFPAHRLHLIQGDPGAGKTTAGLQYLIEGARRGEPVLYVTLSETEEELRSVSASHVWSMDGITVCEPRPAQYGSRPDSHYTIFHPSEIELNQTTSALLEIVDRLTPTRMVIDSLSELRLLARDPLRYRREILSLKHSLSERHCTVVILDHETHDGAGLQLHTLAHGVLVLEQRAPEFGAERRRLRVVKMRGVKFRGGYHDFTIEKRGLVIYPRLIAAEFRNDNGAGLASSGLRELDALVGGGLNRGTSTLLLGAAGSGKSAVASLYATAAANRGEQVAMYVFDEGLPTLISRSERLGMKMQRLVENGQIAIRQIDPAEMSPGEFAHDVRESVQKRNVRLVVIDSLNGYLNAMPEEEFLVIQLHELLSFLAHYGVVTLLVVSQAGLLGSETAAPVDISYLADTVVLFRYFESAGQVRKAVSVLKNRSGDHERTIRELIIASGRIELGDPLVEFEGILSGMAIYNPTRNVIHG